MRPFPFAKKMQKIRDFKLDFSKFFWGIAPKPLNGEGLRSLSSDSCTPQRFAAYRFLLQSSPSALPRPQSRRRKPPWNVLSHKPPATKFLSHTGENVSRKSRKPEQLKAFSFTDYELITKLISNVQYIALFQYLTPFYP